MPNTTISKPFIDAITGDRAEPDAAARPIRIQVQCDDPLVCAGLTATLRGQPGFELLPPGAGDPQPGEGRADIVVADYEQGLALIARSRLPGQPYRGKMPNVLIVTRREGEWEIRHALELGVRGYLIMGCALDELVDAVRTVHLGMRHIGALAARRLADSLACSALTSRETEVLRLVAQGRANKAVARELDIALGTVKSHLKKIFEKLGARSRTEVATVAEKRGLLMLPASTQAPRPREREPQTVERRALPMFGSAVH